MSPDEPQGPRASPEGFLRAVWPLPPAPTTPVAPGPPAHGGRQTQTPPPIQGTIAHHPLAQPKTGIKTLMLGLGEMVDGGGGVGGR